MNRYTVIINIQVDVFARGETPEQAEQLALHLARKEYPHAYKIFTASCRPYQEPGAN